MPITRTAISFTRDGVQLIQEAPSANARASLTSSAKSPLKVAEDEAGRER